MESERLSYCLLFFALLLSRQGNRSVSDVLRVIELSPSIEPLARAVEAA